ncbi:MAG: response regulator, partial [Planctomycetota bacterium JB042]
MSKVLIVEDDVDICRALMIRLKAAGYDVTVAHDALAGLREAVKVEPDLAILDISMPAGNGFTLAERMMALPTTAMTRFLFMTASKRSSFRERANELGAKSFIEKPFDSATLLEAVAGALADRSEE